MTNTFNEADHPRAAAGKFSEKHQTESAIALTPPGISGSGTSQLLRLQRFADSAARRQDVEVLDVIREEVKAAAPNVTTLELAQRSGSWEVVGAFTADNTRSDIPDLTAATKMLSAELHRRDGVRQAAGYDGHVTVHLDQVTHSGSAWTINEAAEQTFDFNETLGTLGPSQDIVEAQYQIEENYEEHGLQEGTWDQLVERYGNEEKALIALRNTQAWTDAHERAADTAQDILADAIRNALTELNEGPTR